MATSIDDNTADENYLLPQIFFIKKFQTLLYMQLKMLHYYIIQRLDRLITQIVIQDKSFALIICKMIYLNFLNMFHVKH